MAAMDAAKELKEQGIDGKIFMLVHDSIVGLVKEEHVDAYCKLLADCTQRDRGCGIPNTPIGIDQEVGDDYSFGKFVKTYEIIGDKLSRLPT
jgi:DNA polymerase I-like protein with 3'-5' exonuclease and polymerase domains